MFAPSIAFNLGKTVEGEWHVMVGNFILGRFDTEDEATAFTTKLIKEIEDKMKAAGIEMNFSHSETRTVYNDSSNPISYDDALSLLDRNPRTRH